MPPVDQWSTLVNCGFLCIIIITSHLLYVLCVQVPVDHYRQKHKQK